jgi:PhnB protein
MNIPDGFGTVFPYFLVDDAGQLLGFLKNAFGAIEIGRTVTPNGRMANCRVRIGTSSFMVSEVDRENFKPTTAATYIYVDDADRVFAKALQHGAKEIFAPANMPYQDRQAGVFDPAGNIWWISQRLVSEPYDA